MKINIFSVLCIFIHTWISRKITICEACVEITGIGTDTNDIYALTDLSEWPLDNVWVTFVRPTVIQRDPNVLALRETPIQFRFLLHEAITIFNTLSYYDDTAIEFWSREDVMDSRRRCNDANTDEDEFDMHRSVALAYSVVYIISDLLPELTDELNTILSDSGVDPFICDNNACDETDISTPWGLAYAVFSEMKTFGATDGWNADGSLNRDYNKLPFSDFRDNTTKYAPVNNPWDTSMNDMTKWQALLETDNLGYFTFQDHVTPHLGYTGKSVLYSNDEFCDRSEAFQDDSDNHPNYDYEVEIDLALNRMSNLSDTQKMFIERFDNKGILNGFRQSYVNKVLGYGRDTLAATAIRLMSDLCLYESVVAIWKEKTDFDIVRPPSIVHEMLDDTLVTSYAGTTSDGATYGTQTFEANNWEPYIRTMPHAEYPSASSCICQAWSNAMIYEFGVDDFSGVLPAGTSLRWGVGASSYEPLSTPASQIVYSFYSFSEISYFCGESRLWGGMHFTKSIDAGRDFCGDIGSRVVDSVDLLMSGEKPQFVADITDDTVVERSCYPTNL